MKRSLEFCAIDEQIVAGRSTGFITKGLKVFHGKINAYSVLSLIHKADENDFTLLQLNIPLHKYCNDCR